LGGTERQNDISAKIRRPGVGAYLLFMGRARERIHVEKKLRVSGEMFNRKIRASRMGKKKGGKGHNASGVVWFERH